jgi:uncharacterized SAM-dependent methyltransferase
MATISVTIPEVTEYTVTPSRLSPTTFFVDRETRLSEEATRIPEQNTQATALNTFKTQANAVRDEVNGFKTAAETAQGLSEDARDASIVAQGLAEDAQVAAEAAVASIPAGSINDSITTLVDTWSSSKINSLATTVNNTLASTSTTEALSANMGKTLKDAQDLKALAANPIFTGLIKEQVSVSTLTLGATSSVQTYTATANFTIVDDLVSGEFVTFIVTNAGWTPTYPTMTWWETDPPVLGTTDKIFFEKIGSTLYGSHVASIA